MLGLVLTAAMPLPQEIVAQAAEAMLSLDSLHFNIEREGALAYIDAGQLLAFKRAEGEFRLPDQMRAIVRVITAFTPVEIGMVVLGDDQYATDPITGKWGRLPPEWGQFNLVVLFDPQTGLQGLLKPGIPTYQSHPAPMGKDCVHSLQVIFLKNHLIYTKFIPIFPHEPDR